MFKFVWIIPVGLIFLIFLIKLLTALKSTIRDIKKTGRFQDFFFLFGCKLDDLTIGVGIVILVIIFVFSLSAFCSYYFGPLNLGG